jgi:hypothetical protein
MDSLDNRPKRWNTDMRIWFWNVRNLYRASSLMTVSRELSRYMLDLVGVQEVRWEGGWHWTCRRILIFFFTERGMRIMNLVQVFLCVRESYQQWRGLSLLVIGCHTWYWEVDGVIFKLFEYTWWLIIQGGRLWCWPLIRWWQKLGSD